MEQQLFDAIKAGNVDDVRRLIQENPSLTQARDGSGASVILVATYNMKPAVVDALVGASCATGTSGLGGSLGVLWMPDRQVRQVPTCPRQSKASPVKSL
jgi:hypothetical protein